MPEPTPTPYSPMVDPARLDENGIAMECVTPGCEWRNAHPSGLCNGCRRQAAPYRSPIEAAQSLLSRHSEFAPRVHGGTARLVARDYLAQAERLAAVEAVMSRFRDYGAEAVPLARLDAALRGTDA